MRRVSLALLLVAGIACGGSPTKPDPIQDQKGWGGNVTFSQVVTGGPEVTVAWTGTVFWDDSLLSDLKTGAAIFDVKSGKVSATYTETSPCTASGSAPVTEVSINPQKDSTLTVQPDGSYTGAFHAVATILVTTHCKDIPDAPPDPTYVGLDLIIAGTANGLSLKGDMVPIVFAGTTYKGSWEFAPLTTAARTP